MCVLPGAGKQPMVWEFMCRRIVCCVLHTGLLLPVDFACGARRVCVAIAHFSLSKLSERFGSESSRALRAASAMMRGSAAHIPLPVDRLPIIILGRRTRMTRKIAAFDGRARIGEVVCSLRLNGASQQSVLFNTDSQILTVQYRSSSQSQHFVRVACHELQLSVWTVLHPMRLQSMLRDRNMLHPRRQRHRRTVSVAPYRS